MINQIVLMLVIVISVVGAGFFAGAETGVYQLSQLRLRLGIEKKRLSFVILGKSLHDRAALLISLLIGNNLGHYLGTSVVTYMLLRCVEAEHIAELLATLIITPILFVFSELIPKNIFFYRADLLMPIVAPILFVFNKLFTWCGIVGLLKIISRIFAQLTGSPIATKTVITAVQRHHIRAIFQETQEEDLLSNVQTDMLSRVVRIPNISIRSVMTPINKVEMVDANFDKAALFNKLRKCAFARLPVYEGSAANIIGFINIYETLSSSEQFTNLHNFIKPIRKLAGEVTVSEAINIMRNENQKIVLVMSGGHSGREKPIGIVTMKDLVEELLGELAEW
ncbi:MAG: CNNM domain-containing protein [Planctomycetota bacterium]|jgi:CBS domain containing-hemolysin-like protein